MEQRNKVRGLALDRQGRQGDAGGRAGPARASRAAVFEPLAEAGINVDMIVQNVGHAGATDLSFTVPAVDLRRCAQAARPGRAASWARGS